MPLSEEVGLSVGYHQAEVSYGVAISVGAEKALLGASFQPIGSVRGMNSLVVGVADILCRSPGLRLRVALVQFKTEHR